MGPVAGDRPLVFARVMGPADRQGHGATRDLPRRLTWASGPRARLTAEAAAAMAARRSNELSGDHDARRIRGAPPLAGGAERAANRARNGTGPQDRRPLRRGSEDKRGRRRHDGDWGGHAAHG